MAAAIGLNAHHLEVAPPDGGALRAPPFGLGFDRAGTTQTPISVDFWLRPDFRLQMARLQVGVAVA